MPCGSWAIGPNFMVPCLGRVAYGNDDLPIQVGGCRIGGYRRTPVAEEVTGGDSLCAVCCFESDRERASTRRPGALKPAAQRGPRVTMAVLSKGVAKYPFELARKRLCPHAIVLWTQDPRLGST